MSANYNPSDELPQGLVLRLDIEVDGHAHLYSALPDDQAVEALRDLANGLEEDGSKPQNAYRDGDAIPRGDEHPDLDSALRDLLGD